ncbi:MAG: putative sugar nucleotidyl transferase [Bacteroidota bacterium]|jgi:UDP-N-acetylglucosamine diphosphorylase/glucosamine-1-phosphate N-acetyltransferase|nr:putative sugar nucleotidyl transferase [Bacteroidota bacterium]
MSIRLFEDFSISTLFPLTHLHPDFDLRCGILTGRERVARYFSGEPVALAVRLGLTDVMAERSGLRVNGDDAPDLYINGAMLLTASIVARLRESRGEDRLFIAHDRLVAATVVSEDLRHRLQRWLKSALLREELSSSTHAPDLQGLGAPMTAVDATLLRFPWDIIEHNRAMIAADAEFFLPGAVDPRARISATAELIHGEGVSIGAHASIGAGVVLDATDGPIVIHDDVEVMPQAVILGPAFIGAGTRVKVAAKIYGGSSIGPHCRVGGEIEDSVFHSYANKQHDGFVGHSYFAPWTNLGADSNTSDLKNNYGSIRVTLEGQEYDTGRMFLGTIMADHAKCGINTMFNTGTTIGVGCNIHGGGFPPKYLPSFSWGGADGLEEYAFDRFRGTADIVMRRRNRVLTESEHRLLHDVFATTAAQRRFASSTP